MKMINSGTVIVRRALTCVFGFKAWLLKLMCRSGVLNGLSKAKSNTGFSIGKEDCDGSKVSTSTVPSSSSFNSTDREH